MSKTRSTKTVEEIMEQIKLWNKNKPFSEVFRDSHNNLCTCQVWLRRGTKKGDKCPNCGRIIPIFI